MIICADDFNLKPEHDEAILKLADAGRISAVSVMTAMRHGASPLLPQLRAMRSKLDVGLHLVLTAEGAPCSKALHTLTVNAAAQFHQFRDLVTLAYCRRLDFAEVQREIEAQIQAFMTTMGAPPDFIDGHLHVQQLPIIRQAVVQAAIALNRTRHCYVRHAWTPPHLILYDAFWKHCAIALPGAQLRRALHRQALPSNRYFFGIYDYRRRQNFAAQLPSFIARARAPNDIIMTHPGYGENWRELEFHSLMNLTTIKPNRFRPS